VVVIQMIKFCSLLIVGIAFTSALVFSATQGESATKVTASEQQSADQQFTAIWQREWQWRMQQMPSFARDIGEPAPLTLGKVDLEAELARKHYWQTIRAQLQQIDAAQLSAEQHTNYQVYRAQIDDLIAEIDSNTFLLTINSDSSYYGDLAQLPASMRFASEHDYLDYLQLLNDVPRYFAEHESLLRLGLKRGVTVPKIVLAGRDQAIEKMANGAVEDSPFYAPFREFPNTIPEALQQKLRQAARTAIQRSVQPAYQRVLKFMREHYQPGARKTIAAVDLPDGERFYQAQIKSFTTLDLSADAIHKIGLEEVARIDADMQKLMRKTGFDGDFAAFLSFLRTDPQFYASSPEQLLAAASVIAKRIDAKLPQYFSKLPRQPYGVAPVPDAIAPYYTSGRYVPGSMRNGQSGTYWVNTYKLSARPLYVLPALTLHEAVPGHHLQGALAAEAEDLPPFRRHIYISAYGEGWALYAEHLGDEMGIYQNDYEQFGRLSYEMWRACRLVVDTGIHAKHWTRAKAIAYMRAHAALSVHEIETEVDRYISWPGQALSYKLGEIEIRKLRQQAQTELGASFDLRQFHDQVLALGSVPLTVLRGHIERWIKAQSSATKH
jgi:uncharacterized protein (DUF885 family)